MPPFREERLVDRGLSGRALRVLEESGHGRRVAIVDTSYPIPRWAETVDYRGRSSADALLGVVRLIPVEGEVEFMSPDPEDSREEAKEALEAFNQVFIKLESEIPELQDQVGERHRLDKDEPERVGFYSLVNNEEVDTLFIRTADRLPYACATFVIEHSQVPETVQEEVEKDARSLGYASFDEFREFSESHQELGTSRVPRTLWGKLMRVTSAASPDDEKRGILVSDDHEFELFKIEPLAHLGYSGPMLERSKGYSINLDTLELLAKGGYMHNIPILGPKHERLALEFIEARRTKIDQSDNS